MAKYKVLLADDEYWAREKIRNMIQWENYSLEFLEPARDGEQVLEKLERCRPDILITEFGRSLYAVGGSESSAGMMGLDVKRTKMKAYVLSSILCSIGGNCYCLNTMS